MTGRTGPFSAAGCGGRALGTLFGLTFLVLGLLFLVSAGREFRKGLEIRGWPEVPCRILSSRARLDGPDERPYRFEVTYRYRAAGGTFPGDAVSPAYAGSSDYRPVQRLLLRYPPGARTTCRVNPDDPSEAYLEPPAPTFTLVMAIPLLFVLVGATVLAGTWRKRRSPGAPEALGRASPGGKRLLLAVGGVFLAAGLGTGAAMLPWMTGPLRARGWTPVQARVVSAAVRRHEGEDTVTWSLDILYEYPFGGRTYRSNRWGWVKGSSSGLSGKREVVRRHPPGSTLTVWVDPRDPTMAVAVPGYTLRHLLFLIPVVLTGLGVLLLLASRRAAAAAGPEAVPEVHREATSGPLVLAPGRGRFKQLAGLLFITLFWNGIVGVFAREMIQGFRRGHPDWFLTVFLIPFVLVGLFLVGAFVHGLLGLANPSTTLRVTPATPRLGDELRVSWSTRGRVGRLARLQIVLEGSESATYRRGTDTHTDTRVFARLPVADLREPYRMESGEASLRIPAETMHSFDGGSNKVTWRLKVKGEIPRWPDVDDAWEIAVAPMPVEGGGPWGS